MIANRMIPEMPVRRKVYFSNKRTTSILAALFFMLIGLFQIWSDLDLRLVTPSTGNVYLLYKVSPRLAISLLLFLIGVMSLYSAWGVRLVILPEGVEYHALIYGLSTNWENIELIGPSPKSKWTEGLILRQPADQIPGLLRPFKTSEHFIPLSTFAVHWRGSQLEQDLRQYAPHLFADK